MSDQVQLKFGFPETGERRRKRTPLLVVFVALLLAAIVLSGCQKPRTPSEELIAAMKKTYDFENYEVFGNLTFNMVYEDEIPEAQVISQMFNNITLELRQKCDRKSLRNQIDLDLFYKGQNCGSLSLYADLKKIALQSPLLSSKPIVFYWEDFADLTAKYLNGVQIHIDDYFPLIFDEERSMLNQLQEESYSVYAAFLAERVTVNPEKVYITLTEGEEEKTYICKEYILNFNNGDTLYEDYQTLLVDILENERIRSLLQEKIEEAVEIAKNNGDLETWPWTEEEIRAFAENLDAHLYQLVEAFRKYTSPEVTSDLADQMKMDYSIDYRINVDKSGLLRNIVMSQTICLDEEEIPVTVSTAVEMQMLNFGKQPAFMEFDPANAFDAGKASEAEWTALGQEVGINLIGQLFLNPLVQDFVALFDTEEDTEETF